MAYSATITGSPSSTAGSKRAQSSFYASRRIGGGGMGDVYLGFQEGIGGFERLVVIKRIHEELAQVEEFATLFLKEAQIAATLQHPNIVRILDVGLDDDGLYAALEHIAGETVEYISKSQREGKCERMPWQLAGWLVARIAEALHYAHSEPDAVGQPRRIVHRDVCPSNILIGYDGRPVLLDFGIANAADGLSTERLDMVVGTVGYQSPEQIANIAETPASDVFQLAAILFELTTGARLIDADDEHQAMLDLVEKPLPRANEVEPSLPDALCAVLDQALEIDWETRTQSADIFRRALDDLLHDQPLASREELAQWMSSSFSDRRHKREELIRSCREETRRVDQTPIPPLFQATAEREAVPAPTMRQTQKVSRRRMGSLAGAIAAVMLLVALLVLLWPRGAMQTAQPAAGSAMAAVVSARAAQASPTATSEPAASAHPAEEAPALSVRVEVEPAQATISLDGAVVGTGAYEGEVAGDRDHELVVAAPGHQPARFRFRDEPPPAVIVLKESVAAVAARKPPSPTAKAETPTAVSVKKAVGGPSESRTPGSVKKTMGTDNVDPWAAR